jgi:hypothetical protein
VLTGRSRNRHPFNVQRDRACSLPALTVFAFTLRPVAALAQDAAVGNLALPRDLTPWGMHPVSVGAPADDAGVAVH